MINYLNLLSHANPGFARQVQAAIQTSPHPVTTGAVHVGMNFAELMPGLTEISPLLLPEAVRDAVPARRASFLGGRLCAEVALLRLGAGAWVVHRLQSGAPCWPTGITGSITHTGSLASAAAAPVWRMRSLGIDSEPVTDDKGLECIRRLCCTEAERGVLRASGQPHLLATLMFSLKESFYKCAQPVLKRAMDFCEVELVALDWQGTMARLASPGYADLQRLLRHCRAGFSVREGTVHTAVSLASEADIDRPWCGARPVPLQRVTAEAGSGQCSAGCIGCAN